MLSLLIWMKSVNWRGVAILAVSIGLFLLGALFLVLGSVGLLFWSGCLLTLGVFGVLFASTR